MKISKAKEAVVNDEQNIGLKRLRGGMPLIVRVESIESADMIMGRLIVRSHNTPENTRINIRQAPFAPKNRMSLNEMVAGNEHFSPLRPGDIVCFNAAIPHEGQALVEAVSIRTHDMLIGNVQVMTAMVSPSQLKVTKREASQNLTMCDTTKAMLIGDTAAIQKAWEYFKREQWPGGDLGFIVRDSESADSWFETKDRSIDALIEEMEFNNIFTGGTKLEFIPAWRLKMSYDQIRHDANPFHETKGAITGPFTRMYDVEDHKGNARRGFLPSLVIASDGDEILFGGKTGRTIRYAQGVQPTYRRQAVSMEKMPSNLRPYGGKPNSIPKLFSDDDMEKAAAERTKSRVARHGSDPLAATKQKERAPDYEDDNQVVSRKPFKMKLSAAKPGM